MDEIQLPTPVSDLLPKVMEVVSAEVYNWEDAAILREKYREEVYATPSVSKKAVENKFVKELLLRIETLCLAGIEKSKRPNSPLVSSFFYRDSELSEEVLLNNSTPKKIKAKSLPLFLEGQVHLLRLVKTRKEALSIYSAIKESPLYDQILKTYILNEDLTACTQEIGRIRTFTRGIYENESVWLHMAYKVLVELLRHGLYDEFFNDIKTVLVPFLDPECYGRSIFENSSYITSSSCPDQNIHGRGFVARLSGSTAEFIHIWLHLTTGYTPFSVEKNELTFRLKPVLPGEWFTTESSFIEWSDVKERIRENSFACSLFGNILLVYRNENRLNTWGKTCAKVQQYIIDGTEYTGETLSGEIAHQIRNRKVSKIEVLLG